MTETVISRAIAERGVAVGAMLFEFDTPRVMRILGAAGVDFALFDLEHTAWDAGTLRTLYAAGLGTGVYPITRVVRAQYTHIATALDAGSRGIMAPMVESADEARLLVESAKFPPVGRRGFGVIMSDELEGGPAAMADRANRENLVIAQIESPAGIENAESIVSVPGVDAVWLGQFDLSLSLGIPGEFGHPRFTEAVGHLLDVCRRNQKPLGQLIASTADGAAAAALGFQILAYADVWVFENALRDEMGALRRTVTAQRSG
jgi:2-keto-3-deoxy-L-rhamnonate aldolase RhmA